MRNQRRLRPVSRLPEGVSRTVGWGGGRGRGIGCVRCLLWPHEYLCKTAARAPHCFGLFCFCFSCRFPVSYSFLFASFCCVCVCVCVCVNGCLTACMCVCVSVRVLRQVRSNALYDTLWLRCGAVCAAGQMTVVRGADGRRGVEA